MIEALFTAIAFAGVFGVIVGSFLNVCIDRLPAGQSLFRPPSHCPVCQRRLAPRDLVPIISYLWLRGRCRYCGARIPSRLLWVELGTGLAFAFLYWQYGISVWSTVLAVYFCLLIVILVIDIEQGLILNKVVYPASALALVAAFFTPDPGIVKAVAGGLLGLAIMLAIALLYRGGMGWGDIKMAMLIGVMVGFPMVLVALLVAVVSGGMIAVVLLVSGAKGRKEALAFGPFLSLATMATLLWGRDLVAWYLRLF